MARRSISSAWFISSAGSIRRPSERFQKAVAIDPPLTDAHFQLGRIAREQGRAARSSRVLSNGGGSGRAAQFKRSAARIRRDLRCGPPVHGRAERTRGYIERRPYDPEGLYCTDRRWRGSGEAAGGPGCYICGLWKRIGRRRDTGAGSRRDGAGWRKKRWENETPRRFIAGGALM